MSAENRCCKWNVRADIVDLLTCVRMIYLAACSLWYLVGSELRLEGAGRESVEVDRDEVSTPSLPPSAETCPSLVLMVFPYKVLEAGTFLCQIFAREFIFAPVRSMCVCE